MNFIRTTDKDTALMLKKHYNEIPSGKDGVFLFVNDPTLKFSSDIDIKKICYTNKLFI